MELLLVAVQWAYCIAPSATQVKESVTYFMTKNLCDSDNHGYCAEIKEEVHAEMVVTTKEHMVKYEEVWSIFQGNSWTESK